MVLKSEILSQEKDVVFKERLKELLELSQKDDILNLIQNFNRRYSTWEKIAKNLMEENKKMMKNHHFVNYLNVREQARCSSSLFCLL